MGTKNTKEKKCCDGRDLHAAAPGHALWACRSLRTELCALCVFLWLQNRIECGGSRRDDLLSGGAGEDFLYGGLFLSPFFDAAKTEIIISVWTSNALYADKVRNLNVVGVGPGRSIKLDRSQQIFDGVVDTYIGGSGLDWFFIESNESGTLRVGGIRDLELGETVGP